MFFICHSQTIKVPLVLKKKINISWIDYISWIGNPNKHSAFGEDAWALRDFVRRSRRVRSSPFFYNDVVCLVQTRRMINAKYKIAISRVCVYAKTLQMFSTQSDSFAAVHWMKFICALYLESLTCIRDWPTRWRCR